MKPASFIISFKDVVAVPTDSELDAKVEFLPCQFQSNIDSCNRHVYFDPIIKPVAGTDCKPLPCDCSSE